MSVRVVRLCHPRPSDRVNDEPYEQEMFFDRVYQDGDRLIAVGPEDGVKADGPRQFNARYVTQVDFERLDTVPVDQMLKDDVPGEGLATDRDDLVERLS